MKNVRQLLRAVHAVVAAALFLRRWHRQQHGDWPVPPSAESAWEKPHAEALAAFLRTEGGRQLLAELRRVDLRTTAYAVYSQTNSREFRCGYAAGFRATVSYLVTLSTPPAAHAGPEPDGHGAAALLERLAP